MRLDPDDARQKLQTFVTKCQTDILRRNPGMNPKQLRRSLVLLFARLQESCDSYTFIPTPEEEAQAGR